MPPLTDHQQLAEWAALCAERVLGAFETERPHDLRPRKAIEAARFWRDGSLAMIDARKFAFASHSAAREATNPAAIAAARAAGHAAATAHVATHAPHAAAYALKAVRLSHGDAEDEQARQIGALPSHLRLMLCAP